MDEFVRSVRSRFSPERIGIWSTFSIALQSKGSFRRPKDSLENKWIIPNPLNPAKAGTRGAAGAWESIGSRCRGDDE